MTASEVRATAPAAVALQLTRDAVPGTKAVFMVPLFVFRDRKLWVYCLVILLLRQDLGPEFSSLVAVDDVEHFRCSVIGTAAANGLDGDGPGIGFLAAGGHAGIPAFNRVIPVRAGGVGAKGEGQKGDLDFGPWTLYIPPMPRTPTEIVTSIVLPHPAAEIFDFITTAGHWNRWHPATVNASGAADHPAKAGEKIFENIRLGFLRGTIDWIVRECRPPGRWAIGASRQGRINKSVQVRPRRTDSRPRSVEGAVVRELNGRALRQHLQKGGCAKLQVAS